MPVKSEPEFGKADALSPEWAAYESRWSVQVSDFASPLEAAKFLARRKEFFAATQKAGFPKEMLAGFDPAKPGFIERATDAFDTLVKQTRHAAE
jgi:hypothetical protein